MMKRILNALGWVASLIVVVASVNLALRLVEMIFGEPVSVAVAVLIMVLCLVMVTFGKGAKA